MEEDEFENDGFYEELSASLDDVKEDGEQPKVTSELVSFVNKNFHRAETKKYSDEQRFLRAYRNFRGLYGPDVQFNETEKSRVFVKVTKTKTLAAYGQIIEVLFGGNKFPLSIEPSKLPEGVVESVHVNLDPKISGNKDVNSITASGPLIQPGKTLQPGATLSTLAKTGPLKQKLSLVEGDLQEGEGTTPSSVTFHPAVVAAKKMEKKIHDQLEESNGSKNLRHSAFECSLFGTGILKGPFVNAKEYPSWTEDGLYEPVIKDVPEVSHVSVWNFYPDPDAANMDECEFAIERHKMTYSKLAKLRNRPDFRANAIKEALDAGSNYERKYWELVMEDDSAHAEVDRYEVLEYWGYVPIDEIDSLEEDLIKDLDIDEPFVNLNVWVCNGHVLKAVVNPFEPQRLPYHAFPYELNPYSFFGIGVAENMDDTQTLMNGFMRMAVDNAALSGNLVFEVDESNLTPGQDLKLFPGKVFRRQGGAPGQAIFGTQYPNVAQQNMMLFDKARVLADESTGFPSFAHGQTGVTGVGRTASGISMLMNAANGSVRTVVKNLDDYLITPLGKAFFAWNMQFDHDASIKGDLEVMARGTESLMATEVRSQRLMQFLGVISNPILAPFAKLDVIVREIAKSLDLDPDKVTNNLNDAKIQAHILAKMAPAIAATPAQQQQGAVAGVDANDTTGSGGGNMGTGSVPAPGEQGFSGGPPPNAGMGE